MYCKIGTVGSLNTSVKYKFDCTNNCPFMYRIYKNKMFF